MILANMSNRENCESVLFLCLKRVKVRENSTETCILSHVKQIASPGSMRERRCSGQGAPQIRCTGMTLSDAMGRQVGRGFSIGNTCTPMADSCQCVAKPTTIL